MGWFDRKKHGPNEWTGFLKQGVKVEGKLEASGTFRIDSAMKGTLSSDDTLVLGEHSSVEGTIIGNFVIIAGRFDGVIRAARPRRDSVPTPSSPARSTSPCLVIEPGRHLRRSMPHARAERSRQAHDDSHSFRRRPEFPVRVRVSASCQPAGFALPWFILCIC